MSHGAAWWLLHRGHHVETVPRLLGSSSMEGHAEMPLGSLSAFMEEQDGPGQGRLTGF